MAANPATGFSRMESSGRMVSANVSLSKGSSCCVAAPGLLDTERTAATGSLESTAEVGGLSNAPGFASWPGKGRPGKGRAPVSVGSSVASLLVDPG